MSKIDFAKAFRVPWELRQFWVGSQRKEKVKYFWHLFRFCICNRIIVRGKIKAGSLLFFRSMSRADYDVLAEKIVESSPHLLTTCFFNPQDKLRLYPPHLKETDTPQTDLLVRHRKILNFAFLLRMFSRPHYWLTLLKLYGWFHGSCFFLRYILYFPVFRRLAAMDFSGFVVFADMQVYDNLFIQIVKAMRPDVPTVTLQHGLYVDYTKMPNVNEANYQNVICDYFVAWGEETAQLIHRYKPACKIVVCGNPIELEPINGNCKNHFFTVICDQPLLHDYNQRMLEIAGLLSQRINHKVLIRFHPMDHPSKYSIPKSLQNNLISGIDYKEGAFVLGHTSSMLFQVQRAGGRAFKLSSDAPSNVVESEALFKTSDDLLEKLASRIDFKKLGAFYIDKTGKDAQEAYQKFFLSLINISNG